MILRKNVFFSSTFSDVNILKAIVDAMITLLLVMTGGGKRQIFFFRPQSGHTKMLPTQKGIRENKKSSKKHLETKIRVFPTT